MSLFNECDFTVETRPINGKPAGSEEGFAQNMLSAFENAPAFGVDGFGYVMNPSHISNQKMFGHYTSNIGWWL